MASLHINRRQNSSDKIYNLSLGLILFSPSAVVLLAQSTIFFMDSEIYKSINAQKFLRCFSLFIEKNSGRKTFLVECVRSNSQNEGTASCKRLPKVAILVQN